MSEASLSCAKLRSTVGGYGSSERTADAVIRERLGTFAPAQ
jgi:hypothetical protein